MAPLSIRSRTVPLCARLPRRALGRWAAWLSHGANRTERVTVRSALPRGDFGDIDVRVSVACRSGATGSVGSGFIISAVGRETRIFRLWILTAAMESAPSLP